MTQKIVIVGGSISGLSAARFLVSSGLDVDITLYDKKQGAGENIVCAGGISYFMARKTGIQVPQRFIARRIHKVRFYAPNMNFAEMDLKEEFGLVLWRGEWEEWIAQQVEEKGASVHYGCNVPVGMLKTADVVVGADGITGVTRRIAHRPTPSKRDIHLGVQCTVKLQHYPQDAISLFLSNRLAPEGYGWIFPQGNREYRVGLGVPLTFSSKIMWFYNKFLDKLTRLGMHPQELGEIQGKVIPTTRPPETNVVGNTAFVGDAGLVTDPASGGGIAQGIISAKCLCEALVKGGLQYYDPLWKKALYKKNQRRYGIKQVLTELTDEGFNQLVDKIGDLKMIHNNVSWTLASLILGLLFSSPGLVVKHKMIRRILLQRS